MDIGNARFVARLLVLPSIFLSFVVALGLDTVLPAWLAAVISFALVGPCIHGLAGTMINRRPERWGDIGSAVITTGLAYPVLVWLGGTLVVAVNRSLALAALVFVAPLVALVAVAFLRDPNRGPIRAAGRERQAIAAERRWQFIANGTKVLSEHWATDGGPTHVSARAVLAGEIDGWPVTICDIVARRRFSENRTVTCVVHLPVSLPDAVACSVTTAMFGTILDGHPWTAVEHQGRLRVEDLRLASSDPTFADRLTTPDVCRATIDGDLVYWRIKGRDLSIARQAQGRRVPGEKTLETASALVALARVLPADVIDAYGTSPDQGVPFREPAPHDTRLT